MKLDAVKIENFRSIKKCEIRFHELTAIVGENNSGKTAVLRALNSVFNYNFEKNEFENLVHRHAPKTITRIEVVLDEVPQGQNYDDKIDLDGKLRVVFIYNYSKSSSGKKLFYSQGGVKKAIDHSFIDILKNDIDFVYIPTNRGTKDIEWKEDSIFTRLITKYLEQYTQKRDVLSRKIGDAGNKVLNFGLNGLGKELTDLNMCNDIGEYQFCYKEELDYKLFLDKLRVEIADREGNRTLPASEYGSGIKSLTVIALHRMLARLGNVSIVLGIEEPETNLHPQAQRKLIASLKKSRQACETQAIFATHSTVIVDELNHNDIVLMRKVRNTKGEYQSEVKQIADTFWQDHGIEEFRHYNFFRFRNSDFFFSRFVILTESTTDSRIIDSLIKEGVGDRYFNLSIVSLGGIKNLQYPFFLLKDLGIPFYAIVDKDCFVPYLNDDLENSRNSSTFLPEYKDERKKDSVMDFVFGSVEKCDGLLRSIRESYSKFFNYVKEEGFLPMKYCLEMDLVDNQRSRALLFNQLNIPVQKQNNETLLIKKKNKIKDPEVISQLLQNMQPMDYPISYKKIKKALIERINEI